MSAVMEVGKYSPEFEKAISSYSSEPELVDGPKTKFELYQKVIFSKMFLEFCKRYFDVKGKTFIEIGCGTGTVSVAAALLGAEVAATDIVPLSVELTRKRWAEHHLEGDLFQSDLRNAPRPEHIGKFDFVYCYQVIEHIPREHQFTAIKNLFSMVAPSGYLFIDTENSLCPYDRHDTHTWLLRFLSKGVYDPVMKKLGRSLNYYEHSAAAAVDTHDYISYDELVGAASVSGFKVVSPFMPHGDKAQYLRVLTGSDWLHDSIMQHIDLERFAPISVLLHKI